MKHLVLIDDSSPKGAELLKIVKQFPKETVEFVEDDENLDDCITLEEWGAEFLTQLTKAYEGRKD